ncbi:MAG: replication restart helicase PriA [Spirochaetia bacterium]
MNSASCLLVALRSGISYPLFYLPGAHCIFVGQRVEVPLGKRTLMGYVIAVHTELPALEWELRPILKVLDEKPIFSQHQLDIAQWIAEMAFCSLGEVLFMLGPTPQAEPKDPSPPPVASEYVCEGEILLNQAQKQALNEIKSTEKVSYLFGVTGSGKTHVFLELMRDFVENDKQVLYLVPEISLSYQVEQFLGQFFSADILAVMHSGLTPKRRLQTWRDIQSGQKRIIIGTRSAILAPTTQLGLIILDEEHEATYKSGATPRYHARQVALYLAKKYAIKLVMGSATPSLEAYHAMQEGIFHQSMLTHRATHSVLPEIEVVDMRGRGQIFSKNLVNDVLKTKEKGRQSILFLNRRGFGRFYFCEDCGFELKCKHCSIAMTYHKAHGGLVCHYCGYQTSKPSDCPQCHSLNAGFTTFGLEKAEEQAREIFSDLRIARIDGELGKKTGYLQETLKAFHAGEIDVLLATQIIAKGFNFPHLHLVGIICADVGLSMPDFRASERVFALLTQIIGRAGRYEERGKVVIQTYYPTHTAIVHAAQGDWQAFYQQELAQRKTLFFPPFSRIVRLTFRSKNAQKAKVSCENAAQYLYKNQPQGAEVLGPAEAAIAQIAGNFRWQILLRAPTHQVLRMWIQHSEKLWRYPSQVYCEVDSDPVTLL